MTDFDVFWQAYPWRETPGGKRVKLGKAKAREQYIKAVARLDKGGEFSEAILLEMAMAYAEAQNPLYIKDAFRWLRDSNYEDDYDTQSSDDETDRLRNGLAAAVAGALVPGAPGGTSDAGRGRDGAGDGKARVVRLDAHRGRPKTG